jgi:hypothetical protein
MTVAFGGVDLDPVEIGINGNAILGIKESGKSYLGTELGELLFDSGIPFVTFDPIGIWHNMRYPGAGKGYPIVVAGGFHGDIPLTPASAPTIVEAAMKKGVSVVLDLFHPELSKADWRTIVRECAMLLLHRNTEYGLRHVFIEEAAEFVPQRVFDARVYDAVERLIRMGGNSRLGCTLISPRSQEVNKAVLELCENMFLFRQRGKNALENLKKWLEVAGAAGGDVMKTLPNMPRGECWAWLGGSDLPVHVRVPRKNSFHPDRRAMGGAAEAPRGKAVSVGKFIGALQAELPKIEEEVKANDPRVLKAEVQRLTRALAAAEKGQAPAAPAWPDQREEVAALVAELSECTAAMDRLTAAANELQRRQKAALAALGGESLPLPAVTPPTRRASPAPPPAPRQPAPARAAPQSDGSVPPGCAKPLAALAAVYPSGLTEAQWATSAGYKRSGGTWGTYKGRLRSAGLIEQREGRWFATEVGAAAVGDVELPPAPGPDLVRWWAAKLPGTTKMAEALIEAWPEWLSRDELAARLEMSAAGGTFGTYVGRLAGPGVVERGSDGIRLTCEIMG